MDDLLAHRVRASPDATALVRARDGRAWTYRDLSVAVDHAAGRLAALGVGPGDHLGVVAEPSVAAIRLVHAAARLGATLVPLGHRQTAGELADRVDRADVTTLVCDAGTRERAVDAAGDVPVAVLEEGLETGSDGPGSERTDDRAPDGTGNAGDDAATALADVEPADPEGYEWALEDPLVVAFTSGTTGDPKGVVLTLENVLASAIAGAFRLGVLPDDRWLVALSLHHVGGLMPVYRASLYGTAVVLRRGFDAGGVVDDAARHGATGVSVVPTMLRRMLEARETFPDTLRTVLLGGAPATTDLVERSCRRGVPAAPTYGMTETASQVATARPSEAAAHPGTVGRPLLFADVTVVGDDGDPVPDGDRGELVVSGPMVTPGYYDDGAATAAAFGPYGLHTGDAGRVVDGRVTVLNRLDDRILTGGENVDPGEVVGVLRGHPGVRDVAVVGLDDPEWGERVAALVVPEPGASLDAATLEAHCRDNLAGFKLPRTWAFAEALPRTASGTVERAAVRERLAEVRDGDGADPREDA
jgi:O-succinylbenzoic acid--CoA ligase